MCIGTDAFVVLLFVSDLVGGVVSWYFALFSLISFTICLTYCIIVCVVSGGCLLGEFLVWLNMFG